MSLMPGFSRRCVDCPVVLMKCKGPFRLTSERPFVRGARLEAIQPGRDGYLAVSVVFAA